MTSAEAAALNRRSVSIRAARRLWKDRLRETPQRILEVLEDPPNDLLGVDLPTLLRWVPSFGDGKMEALGAKASHPTQRVNLLVTLERATPRTRQWLAHQLRQAFESRP